MAVFFQKHNGSISHIIKRFYIMLFLRSEKTMIRYLRDAGAHIGENDKYTHIGNIDALGSEPYLVDIGDNVYFASGVRMVTHDGSVGRLYHMGFTDKMYDSFGKIRIGSNCFIGINSVIMKGAEIGDNCIIGAGSIVTKKIPDNSVACGVPAHVIGSVEDFYRKNKDNFSDTVKCNPYKKRMYLENMYGDKNE